MPETLFKANPEYIKRLRNKLRRLYNEPIFEFEYRRQQVEEFRAQLIQVFGRSPYIYINLSGKINQIPTKVYLADYFGWHLYLENACLFLMAPNREFSICASFCVKEEQKDVRFTCDSALPLWLVRFGPLIKPYIDRKTSFNMKCGSVGSDNEEFQSDPFIPSSEIELIHREMDLINAKAIIPIAIDINLLGFLSLGESFMFPRSVPNDHEEEFQEKEISRFCLYAFKLLRLLTRKAY